MALVGVGPWGKNLLRVLDSRTEVGICCNHSDPTIRGWLGERYPNVVSTFDYGEVLNDTSIEAVIIATPIETHSALTLQALEAGKHVFVEKPLANRVDEARHLVDSARKKGLVLFVGHIYLYHLVFQQLRNLTRHDSAVYAQMMWSKFGGFADDIVWDLAIHEVAIALEIFGRQLISTTVLHQKGLVTSCDIFSAKLEFVGSGECLMTIDRCAPNRRKSVTVATNSGKIYSWENDSLFQADRDGGMQLIYQTREEPLALEIDAFLRSVREGVPSPTEGEFGFKVVEATSRLLA